MRNITDEEYDEILEWTVYSYIALILFKLGSLGWLRFYLIKEQSSCCVKFMQFLTMWLYSSFLPYGDFIVDLGYKQYVS